MSAKEFAVWRSNAQNLYRNLIMHSLEHSTVSLNCVKQTVFCGDSVVLGLLIASLQNLFLYNVILPNRESIEYNRAAPNSDWGKVSCLKGVSVSNVRAVDVSQQNSILVGTDWGLTLFTEGGSHDFKIEARIHLIKFRPKFEEACISLDNGRLLFLKRESLFQWGQFENPVVDVSYDPFSVDTCLLVAAANRRVCLCDTREPQPELIEFEKHVLSVEFAPTVPFLFAAGQKDGVIGIRDIRRPDFVLETFKGSEPVTKLKWSKRNRHVIGSVTGKSITLWSVKSGEQLFRHNGHMSPVIGFDWCDAIPWTAASIGQDHLLEVWTVSPSCVGEAG